MADRLAYFGTFLPEELLQEAVKVVKNDAITLGYIRQFCNEAGKKTRDDCPVKVKLLAKEHGFLCLQLAGSPNPVCWFNAAMVRFITHDLGD